MAFLTLNGFTVRIADGTFREDDEIIGNDERAFSGEMVSDIRATKRSWRARTTPLLESEAEAVRGLLYGRGHKWDFEDAGANNAWKYSSKGLVSTSITGATRSTTSPKFGTAKIQLAASTGAVSWAVGFTGQWTAMVWRNTGSGWEHYIETSTGVYYANGSPSSQQGWFLVDGSGNFTLRNPTGAAVDFDDLVVLPYVITAGMASVFGTAAVPFSDLPEIYLSGDCVGGDTIAVVGRDLRSQYTQLKLSGSWRNNAKEIEFVLFERRTESFGIAGFINEYSVQFDGVDEYITMGDISTVDGLSQCTWSAWIRYNGTWTAGDGFFAKGFEIQELRTLASGAARFYITATDYFNTANGTFTGNTWYHVVAVFDGTQTGNSNRLRFYVNGTEVTGSGTYNGTIPATLAANASALIVGATLATTRHCPCNIDELAIWAGLAATPAQVAEIYNNGSPGDLDDLSFASPTHWWRMGDGDTFPTIIDHGSGGANGTMTNMEAGDISADTP